MRLPEIDFTSVRLEDIGFSYDNDHRLMLCNINAEFAPRQFYHIRGPSGCGKSALLKILAGLLSPQDGSYFINDQEVSDMGFEGFLPYRLNMGYSFELGGLLNNRSLFDNLALPLQYHNLLDPEEITERVNAMLDRFDLKASSILRPSAVSGSMRKAGIIARALILNPKFLILDDPTTGLHREAKSAFFDLLDEGIKSGRIQYVFTVSEDKDFIQRFVTKTYEFSQFQIKEVAA